MEVLRVRWMHNMGNITWGSGQLYRKAEGSLQLPGFLNQAYTHLYRHQNSLAVENRSTSQNTISTATPKCVQVSMLFNMQVIQ